MGPFSLGQSIYVYLEIRDSSNNPTTGLTISDFVVRYVENGSLIAPHGLYLQEIGEGIYILSNQPSSPWRSSSKADIWIDIASATDPAIYEHVNWFVEEFIPVRTTEEITSTTAILNSVNTAIEKVLQGQMYKVGDYYLRYADVKTLFAIRTLLIEEAERLNLVDRRALAELIEPE